MAAKKTSTRSTRTTKMATSPTTAKTGAATKLAADKASASVGQRPVSAIVEYLRSGLTALRKKVKSGAKTGKTDAGTIDAAIARLAQDYARLFRAKGG